MYDRQIFHTKIDSFYQGKFFRHGNYIIHTESDDRIVITDQTRLLARNMWLSFNLPDMTLYTFLQGVYYYSIPILVKRKKMYIQDKGTFNSCSLIGFASEGWKKWPQ